MPSIFSLPSPFSKRPTAQAAADPALPAPHASRAQKKACRKMQARLDSARDVVDVIPSGEGDSLSCLIGRTYDPVNLLRVLVEELARTVEPVAHLRIASLSTSKRCTLELAALLDAGHVRSLSFLISAFQAYHDPDIFADARETLVVARAQKFAAQTNHVKAWLLEFSGGRKLVALGSANLRSSRNTELMHLTWDAPLHDWLAGWIDHMVSTGVKTEREAKAVGDGAG